MTRQAVPPPDPVTAEEAWNRKRDRLLDRLTRYLTDRGEPCLDEVAYLDAGQKLMAEVSCKLITRNEMIARLDHLGRATHNRIAVETLMDYKFQLVRQRPSRGNVVSGYVRWKFRTDLISALMELEVWDEPWMALVDQELPEPRLAGLLRLGPEYDPSAMTRPPKQGNSLEPLIVELIIFMKDQGLNVSLPDHLVVTLLSTQVDIFRRCQTRPQSLQVLHSGMDLVAKAEAPDHPAWNALLTTYFPMT